jgi:hypothetical protein
VAYWLNKLSGWQRIFTILSFVYFIYNMYCGYKTTHNPFSLVGWAIGTLFVITFAYVLCLGTRMIIRKFRKEN